MTESLLSYLQEITSGGRDLIKLRSSLIFPKSLINRFGPVLHMKLFINMMNMLSNGTDRNGKLFSDFFI